MRTIDARTAPPGVAAAEAALVARDGGLIVFPTDTVYGIGCHAHAHAAVERIYAAKNRPRTKPLALHLARIEDFVRYAEGNAAAIALARKFLPGPLTVIVQRPASFPSTVTAGFDTLGLRVPDHALCLELLAATGPLAATSANVSGEPSFTGSQDAGVLPDADLFINNGATPLGTESTVIDVSHAQARLVRAGAIPTDMLERVLGSILR